MEDKWKYSGTVGLMVMVILFSSLYVSDYREILDTFPQENIFNLNSTQDKIDILLRGNDVTEFYKLQFTEGELKLKSGNYNSLVSTWRVKCLSDGAYRRVYKVRGDKYSEISINAYDDYFTFTQIIYFTKGTLVRTIFFNKDYKINEEVNWLSDEKCILYQFNTELDGSFSNNLLYSSNQGLYNTEKETDNLLLNWDFEGLSYVKEYSTGKVYVYYKTTQGNQMVKGVDIDLKDKPEFQEEKEIKSLKIKVNVVDNR